MTNKQSDEITKKFSKFLGYKLFVEVKSNRRYEDIELVSIDEPGLVRFLNFKNRDGTPLVFQPSEVIRIEVMQ